MSDLLKNSTEETPPPPAVKEYSSTREVRLLRNNALITAHVIAEEALEIVLSSRLRVETIAHTMRTPGHDTYLALGYLLSEGAHRSPLQFSRDCDLNQLTIHYAHWPLPDSYTSQRRNVQNSSCGACGQSDLTHLLQHEYPHRVPPTKRWDLAALSTLADQLSLHQPLFDLTGGSHCVWLFSPEHSCLASFEDIGRHNALDKLLGWERTHPVPDIQNCTLVLSSRLSHELVHKAATLGVWNILSIGAPSSLALELANYLELTTIGFFKSASSFNLYTNKRALYYEPS